MEKLFELHHSGAYDVLILDTPPSRNALDFLEAPKRLTQFIEGKSLQMFMKPAGLAGKVVGRGTGMVFSILQRITGVDLLKDLAEFFQAFSGMVDGFRERAKRVTELLSDPATTFIVVCGPQGEPIDEAVYFHRKLVELQLPFGGVIVNKVHYDEDPGDEDVLEDELESILDDGELAAKVSRTYTDYRALALRDAKNIEHLSRELRAQKVIRLPLLERDVHDVGGLAEIDSYLFATAEERHALATGRAD